MADGQTDVASTQRGPAGAGRDPGIDAFRIIAVAAVVLLHALPTRVEDGLAIGQYPALAIPTRFAVPFFFITAGYFQRVEGVPPAIIVARALRRLVPIYVGWILIYWLASRIAPAPGLAWEPNWRKLIQGGPLFHLWFLPALGCGLAFVGVGRVTLGLRATTGIALALAAIGLLLTSYHAPLFGYDVPEPRRGAFFAPAFIVLGAWLAARGVAVSPARGAGIAAAGLALTIAEEAVLRHVMHWPALRSHDISLGTFLYGAGAFLLARSWRAASASPLLGRLGQVSLGIYAAHLYFVRALTPVIGNATMGRAILLAIAALAVTTLVALVLGRVPVLRRLVR